MKFKITKIEEFDVDKELKRINLCFKGKLKTKLIKIVNLFCEEKFQECLDLINSLGYDKQNEHSEKEYLGLFISDKMFELGYGLVDKIEKID